MLPKLLLSRLETILGSDFQSVIDAYSSERNGSFRINTLKSSEKEILEEFGEKGIAVEKFQGPSPEKGRLGGVTKKGVNNGVTHPNPPLSGRGFSGIFIFDRSQEYAIKGTDAFYQGKIYLQSIASILPVLVLDPQKGETILDVCAAPGSKTTQMAMMMENEGRIVALEQNQIRYDKLMYNARLQGATIIEGEKVDARLFLSSRAEASAEVERSLHSVLADSSRDDTLYDRILLDAPCSAEGRIHLANEKSYGFWTLENIKKKSELQYELLSLAVERLRSGGTLVYSTCTLAPEENEGVLTRILESHPELSLEPIDIGLSDRPWWRSGITTFGSQRYSEEMSKAVRILPSGETEGFFIGRIVKK